MPNRKKDLTSATYLDQLGVKSANVYAATILKQIAAAKTKKVVVELPLTSGDLSSLLDNSILGLTQQGKLNWDGMPTNRQQVFIDAWYSTMQKHGIA